MADNDSPSLKGESMKPRPKYNYPVLDLLQKRWSPRAFSSKPIDRNTVLTLFEAARWAASAMNEQPWRFIYATAEEPEKHKKLVQCLIEGNRIWAQSAPLLIMTLVRTNFLKSNQPNKWALHDLGLSIGNLTAQASALDLYVHNMAGFSTDTAQRLFAIPAEYEPVTMIAAGFLGSEEQLPESLKAREIAVQERKPLNELFVL
jgi:nitroreductase